MTYFPVPLRQAVRWHPPLLYVAAAMAALAIVSLVGLAVDDRMLGNVSVWLKPFKFAVSFVAYLVTLAWMVSLMRRSRRIAWWAGTVVAVFGALEVALIVFQAARGRQSHFNNATPLDETIFGAMGATIGVLYLGSLVLAVLLLRQRMSDPAVAWTVRLGLIIALVGMALGFLMLRPTPEQQVGDLDTEGGHSVGVPDGGPGMFLTGWSTTGGDLRIPHFLGMHALQLLPLLAIALVVLAGRFPRLRDGGVRLRLVLVAAATYASLLALVTWQALRGQPLIHPDATTIAVALGLAGASTVGVLIALRQPAPSPSNEDERSAPDLSSEDERSEAQVSLAATGA
ncbi:hypothetical protein I0C86_20595 [Plantactinospora sp. S1510]|uniref:Uncharacterized protein n=1 Tax=Plantactinospora alkalitolerans TaxID=2789879 RepID=A0ABS0GYP4_9ACTN|nr:hypothetical protein [Plantactinospora alkalitolerans]MBF9131343.1 hypothetical protein [Plantactinospora alkalitolerans]